MTATTRFRRLSLLALCAINFALLCYVAFGYQSWDSSFIPNPTKVPFVYRFDAPPGSQAFRAGLRSGDTIDIRTLPAAQRIDWLVIGGGARRALRLTIHRGDRALDLAAPAAGRTPHTPFDWIVYGSIAWALAFCTVLIWRRPADRDTMLLAGALVSWTFIGTVVDPFDTTLSFAAASALAVCSVIFFRVLPVLYALRIAGRSWWIRGLAYAALAAAVVAFLHDTGYVIGLSTGWYDLAMTLRPPASVLFDGTLCPLLNTVCLIAASVAAAGKERARMAWVAAALAPFYLANFAEYVAVAIGAPEALRVLGTIVEVSTFAVPVALTYAATSRKLFDIGFVLNRAAVFSGVSLVLVAAFVLVEWLLSEWLREASHTTNLIVGAAVALALGLSVHLVHGRVDAFVDAVFFRKRHENERAIRAFALEAPYVTERAVLLQRMVEVVERHADPSSVSYVLDDYNGTYSGVSENDPGILRLRAKHDVLNLHSVDTALEGELAYPMVARGRLVGALLVGARRTGEAYAPDESAAIEQLATSVGVSLEALSREVDQRDHILGAIQTLADAIIQRLNTSEP